MTWSLIVLVLAVAIVYFVFKKPDIQNSSPQDASGEDEELSGSSHEFSEGFIGALKYGREIAVVGESKNNPDGISRRSIIQQLDPGDMVMLEREPHNPYDSNAILVRSLKGVIGYVPRDDAAEIATWIDRGETLATYIASIAGGPDVGKADYGVWLRTVSLEQLPQWVNRKEHSGQN